jgi:CheY-like chemotaxis protein
MRQERTRLHNQFRLYLPRFFGDAAVRTVATTSEIPGGHEETVLLVEDELSVLNASKAMLEELDCLVLTASTPGEALRLAEEHAGRIRLLFTDLPRIAARSSATRSTHAQCSANNPGRTTKAPLRNGTTSAIKPYQKSGAFTIRMGSRSCAHDPASAPRVSR